MNTTSLDYMAMTTDTTRNFFIVPFGEVHLKEAAEIEKLCFSEPWSEFALQYMFNSPNTYAVACIDGESGRLAAYGGLEYVLDEAELTNVATHPDFRRRGCARDVLLALERYVAIRGVKRIWLDVRTSNEVAITLYHGFGYTEAGIRPRYYRFPTEDAILMVKNII